MTDPEQPAPRTMRQEQEPATDEIEEIAPGILRTQLPVSMPGLGHVNCYVLEDDRGVAVVDPGLPGEESWNALLDRLKKIGVRLEHVHTAVVTHSHVDHFGGVHYLQAEVGTDLLTHETFRSAFDTSEARENMDSESLDMSDDEAVEAFRQRMRRPTPWGTLREPPPPEMLRRWRSMGAHGGPQTYRTPDPTIPVVDAQVVSLGRRDWVAVHTPGHTHDHLCLFDPDGGLFLSGDHVLPTITPHIGGMGEQQDPLQLFFESLQRMKELDGVTMALPAHGHPFEDLAGRADHIIEHHIERLDIVREAGDELGEATVELYMQRLFKERSWGDMAASETYAHLEHLRILGEVEVGEAGGLKTYRF